MDKFNLQGLDKRIKQQLDLSLKKAGDLAVNHFKRSFRDGGFTDSSFKGWKKRKSKKGTYKKDKDKAYKKAIGGLGSLNVGRAILVKSGHLKNSIHATNLNYSNLSLVISTSGLPYARRHNEGIDKMPKRQFIGNSYKLNTKITDMIAQRIKLAFK